jgi:hypothetical protein
MQAAEQSFNNGAVSYTVTREYVLSDSNPKTPDSHITAQVNFAPPGENGYTLGKAQGGDRVEKIVRKILDRETELRSHADRTSITSRNYEFALLGQETLNGRRCYVVELKPRREVPELLRGKAYVDAADFRIRRIEGEPAKSPSWWVHNVQVSLDYGEVLGLWLQLASRATADVRWMGKHVLTSQAVDVRTQTLTAKNLPPNQSPIRRSAARRVANSAVWVAR